jgi:hypothetical protein
MRSFLTLFFAKPGLNPEAILKTYDLFVYGGVYYTGN